MNFDTNWDVSKYRSPHEPQYQWDLRRKFLEMHKDRFPEERLACLAQTFANIEFMGCRYEGSTSKDKYASSLLTQATLEK